LTKRLCDDVRREVFGQKAKTTTTTIPYGLRARPRLCGCMDGVKVNGVAVLVIASQAFVYEGEESLCPACLDERRNNGMTPRDAPR
jgi:hypothetical protein